MVVRIRLSGRRRRRPEARSRETVLAISSLLTPLSVMAWALGCWRLGADMKWTGEFAITSGLFSHWQVWIAAGLGLQCCSFLLQKIAQRNEDLGQGAA